MKSELVIIPGKVGGGGVGVVGWWWCGEGGFRGRGREEGVAGGGSHVGRVHAHLMQRGGETDGVRVVMDERVVVMIKGERVMMDGKG